MTAYQGVTIPAPTHTRHPRGKNGGSEPALVTRPRNFWSKMLEPEKILDRKNSSAEIDKAWAWLCQQRIGAPYPLRIPDEFMARAPEKVLTR